MVKHGPMIMPLSAVSITFTESFYLYKLIDFNSVKYLKLLRYHTFFIPAASVPFEVTVHFDEDEVWTGAGDANTSEWAMQPGGIMGL